MKQALLTGITRQIVLSYLEKIEDGRRTLGDDVLIRIRGITKAY